MSVQTKISPFQVLLCMVFLLIAILVVRDTVKQWKYRKSITTEESVIVDKDESAIQQNIEASVVTPVIETNQTEVKPVQEEVQTPVAVQVVVEVEKPAEVPEEPKTKSSGFITLKPSDLNIGKKEGFGGFLLPATIPDDVGKKQD